MRARTRADRLFALATAVSAAIAVALTSVVLVEIVRLAAGRGVHGAWASLWGASWSPASDQHGAGGLLYGTLLTSAVALAVAAPVGVGLAVFVRELTPRAVGVPLSRLVALLAAAPSVVYGAWALVVVAPAIRGVADALGAEPDAGAALVLAAVVLAAMSIPTIAQATSMVFSAVPRDLRDAAVALGASRGTIVRMVIVPHVRAGIGGAVLLGLSRAMGESVAVAMVIGNRPSEVGSLLEPGASIGSVLAIEFLGAGSEEHRTALARLALLLVASSVAVELVAHRLVRRVAEARVARRPKAQKRREASR